ncbi:MAG: 30S ribosomal protein S6 [Ignavibacteriales bacterium]|nr:MAG: 30S ribosomal protein S6 [Ignavibacteriales bacterium]
MKTNVYESAVLINAALDDEQIESIISRIKETIVNNGGEIREVENWGRKRLAYMVKKSKIGYYAIFRFNAPSNLLTKLERYYTLDEYILRYLTIKLDADAIEHLEMHKLISSVPEVVTAVEDEQETETPETVKGEINENENNN